MPKVPAFAIALVVVAGVTGCQTDVRRPEEIRPVRVERVAPAPGRETVTFSGEIKPRTEAAVGFRLAGKIVARLVDVGAVVVKGAPLAKLDIRDLALSEQSAKAQLVSAQSALTLAEADLLRQKALLDLGHIARAQYDKFDAQLRNARAQADAASAQLRERANASSYALLVSDQDGVVTAVEAEAGQVVAAGQTVVRIAKQDERELAITVPESQISLMDASTAVFVSPWSAPDLRVAGRVREIAAAADPATRTFRVRIALPDAPQGLRLGMTASVAIDRTLDARMSIPLTAKVDRGESAIVWVVDPAKSVVRAQTVAFDGVAGDRLLIASGLTGGELVVTAGAHLLREGQRVLLPTENASVGAAK